MRRVVPFPGIQAALAQSGGAWQTLAELDGSPLPPSQCKQRLGAKRLESIVNAIGVL